MKHFNSIKALALGAFMAVSGLANAQQTVKPLHYGPGTGTSANWFATYVGIRFQVSTPLSIAGDKAFTTSATSGWGDTTLTNLTDTVSVGPASDTNGCNPYPANHFRGRIALIWRGSCEFGAKALAAQNAGAVAVVIVNNVSGGPVGMAAGASGASVTIPVFMISLDDGTDIINSIYSGNTVVLNILPTWGNGFANDLGFVPTGYSISGYNAIPVSQLMSPARPLAYVQKDGAYVANYGSSNATNVKLVAELSFQPGEAGAYTSLHKDSVTLASFPRTDSVWAMYVPKYNIPAISGTGRFDLKYTISSDATDQFAGDNVTHYYFYATDSIFSKGRYDFANNKPYTTIYTGPSSLSTDPFMWSVPYYIGRGGSYLRAVQFSVVKGGPTALPAGDLFPIYVFKWHDTLRVGTNADSFMRVNDLELVGAGVHTFGGSDSSFQTFTNYIGDSVGGSMAVSLDSGFWYLVAAECPIGYSLGCDGLVNGHPRAFGLHKFDNVFEFYNPIWFGDRRSSTSSTTGAATSMVDNPNSFMYPWAFDGTGSFIIDSVAFNNEKGLIPSLPLITSRSTAYLGTGNVAKTFTKFELYPNPATESVNISVELEKATSAVYYSIIDNSARIIHKEIHHDVTSEVFSFNTTSLPTGVYFMVVTTAEGKTSFKKFAVVR